MEARPLRGPAPEALALPIEVPARWGLAGFVLLGLAAIALLIGGITVSQMRPPPVTGTLLYQVAGKEGAVGRLDLAPVRRRSAALVADVAGRLHLGGAGRTVATVRATRLGGEVVLPAAGAGAQERRLLVDGLVLEAGDHRLRYVSGRGDDGVPLPPSEALPDLLGPEYDIPTGRIERLGRAEPDAGRS